MEIIYCRPSYIYICIYIYIYIRDRNHIEISKFEKLKKTTLKSKEQKYKETLIN